MSTENMRKLMEAVTLAEGFLDVRKPDVWVVSGQRGGAKREVLAFDRTEALKKARRTGIPKPHSVIKIGTEEQLMQTRGFGLNGRKPDGIVEDTLHEGDDLTTKIIRALAKVGYTRKDVQFDGIDRLLSTINEFDLLSQLGHSPDFKGIENTVLQYLSGPKATSKEIDAHRNEY